MNESLAKLVHRGLTGDSASFSITTIFSLFNRARSFIPSKQAPAIRFLEGTFLECLIKGLSSEDRSVWGSLFSPTEILYAADLSPLSLEGMAGILASMGIEGQFLSRVGGSFIPNTMCTYHRLFIEMCLSGAVPKPGFIVATSLLCDGNAKSFRYIAQELDIPYFFIDIPQTNSRENIAYLVGQLEDLVLFLEDKTGRKINQPALQMATDHTKNTLTLLERINRKRYRLKRNLFPGHKFINFILPLHTMMGAPELVEILHAIERDIDTPDLFCEEFSTRYMDDDTIRIVWAHICPSYPYEAWPVIDNGVTAKIVAEENIHIDTDIDIFRCTSPIEIIARRLIGVPGNGSLKRRLNHLHQICRECSADAILHFSSWGCHQVAGAIPLMESFFAEKGIWFLNVNGDCVDSMASSIEQHKTRYEALLESIRKKKVAPEKTPRLDDLTI